MLRLLGRRVDGKGVLGVGVAKHAPQRTGHTVRATSNEHLSRVYSVPHTVPSRTPRHNCGVYFVVAVAAVGYVVGAAVA